MAPLPAIQALTARELEVLQRLAQGESVRAISGKLAVSEKTVANHQPAHRDNLLVRTVGSSHRWPQSRG